MSDRVEFLEGRAVPRLALTGLVLLWLAGCSNDVTRFATSPNPFSNPFGAQTADATPAPAGHVAAAPLAPAGSVASALPPTTASPARAPVASAAPAPVGGSAAGWSARGGTPVVVAQGETLDSLSRRYGVPSAALLSANELSSPAEVKVGMNIVVPVYSAGRAAPPAKAVAETPARKRVDVASNEVENRSAKAKKDKGAAEEKAKAHEKAADKAKEKFADKAKEKVADKTKEKTSAVKTAEAAPAKTTVVAKAEPTKPAPGKKPAIDDTPTGNVDPKAAGAKGPVTAAEADASGSTPEFRWPARGRIIEGFKSGGNDGINISVPPGTSVRAAESGVVVYAGDGLKGYGNLVLIKHTNGFVTAYANTAELDVKRGEQVKRGQIIAKSGDTGNVNSPQLHFEVRKGSTPVDPTQYLAGL
jgi:murein DD-endopeptidase MepM/ murein hydrolase activator NlpD